MNNSDIENAMILEFITANPYPNYNKMLQKLKNHIELWIDYGQQQHICCKTIYENPINTKIIIEMGEKIHELGGLPALSASHSILKYFSPYFTSTNSFIKSQGQLIEDLFFYKMESRQTRQASCKINHILDI
jgi:hypothetical protein